MVTWQGWPVRWEPLCVPLWKTHPTKLPSGHTSHPSTCKMHQLAPWHPKAPWDYHLGLRPGSPRLYHEWGGPGREAVGGGAPAASTSGRVAGAPGSALGATESSPCLPGGAFVSLLPPLRSPGVQGLSCRAAPASSSPSRHISLYRPGGFGSTHLQPTRTHNHTCRQPGPAPGRVSEAPCRMRSERATPLEARCPPGWRPQQGPSRASSALPPAHGSLFI